MQPDTEQIQEQDYRKQIATIRNGIPVSDAESLRADWEISANRFAEILGTSTRQWSRLKKHVGTSLSLGAVETDRLVRMKSTLAQADSIFDDREKAVAWINRPNKALGGEVPLTLMDTDAGIRQIETILTRLEFGVYS